MDNSSKELSVERIRSRMLKNAGKVWGDESEDIESTLDPLVSMLVEACASELFKVNGEILSSQSRILKRLAQILSPETLIGPQSAHAVLHARSFEPLSYLETDAQFYFTKRISSSTAAQKEINKEIFFSPLEKTKLFDADIKYMACNNFLFEYKTPLSKQVISESHSGALEPSVLWLGIELNSKIDSLKNLSFYFDWKNDPDQDSHLQMLPLTKWFLNNKPFTVYQGMGTDHESSYRDIADQFNISLRIEKLIKLYYQNHFFTLHEDISVNNDLQALKKSYPPEFESTFPRDALTKLQENYLWMKLQFTTAFPVEAISDLYISLNSFPVINRKVNKFTYRLQNNFNIVPLSTDDLYLDITSVQTSDGRPFIANPLGSGFKNESGQYTLRYGGIERFDERQASELLNHVLDLLRDESAAFGSLGNDFINSYITQINQALAMIENRIDMKGKRNRPDYFLIVNPFKPDENIYVNFWSTNAQLGNNVKAGSKIQAYTGVEAKSDSILLLTNSTCGKDALTENERITAYKKALLTHDRIVTEQDIRSTCFHELGKLAKDVEVKKEWEVIDSRKQGIRRIIRIIIYPSYYQQLSPQEWNNLIRDLLLKIEMYSSAIIPVKISVNEV